MPASNCWSEAVPTAAVGCMDATAGARTQQCLLGPERAAKLLRNVHHENPMSALGPLAEPDPTNYAQRIRTG
jgi:hypothetical protein